MGRIGEEDEEILFPPLKRPKLISPVLLSTIATGSRRPQISTPLSVAMETEMDKVHMMQDPDPDPDFIGPRGLIRRTEFTRVLIQALFSLGYERAATALEEESGVSLHSAGATHLRQHVLSARWSEAADTLSQHLGPSLPGPFKAALFLLLERKFAERALKGDMVGALETLRSEISPLQINKHRMHQLANCLVYPSALESLFGDGNDSNDSSCLSVLKDLQALLPPDVLLPENRLECLVEQALSIQRDNCVFHNSIDQLLSLYEDHCCDPDHIPLHTQQVLDRHTNEVWFLQFSHDGKYLASASKDNSAIIWEVVNEGDVKFKHALIGHQKPVSLVVWSPDDKMLLTCGNEEVVKLWEVESGEDKHTFEALYSLSTCAWFPDCKRIATGGGDKCVRIWNVDKGNLENSISVQGSRVNDIAVTSDGKHLISVCEKEIRVHNLETKGERVIEEEKAITSLSVSMDGHFLLMNLVNEEIHLWDIRGSVKLLSKYKGHLQTRYVIRSCFGGVGCAFVASGSEDSQVYIWHRGNGGLLAVLPGHSGAVNCVSWNPVNPHMFASASDDHTIRIWGSISKSKTVTSCKRLEMGGGANGSAHVANGCSSMHARKLKPT